MKSLNYILKGTSKALETVAQEYYADGPTERSIHRLMLWQQHIDNYLKKQAEKSND